MIRLRAAAASDIPSIRAIYDHHARNGVGTFDVEAPPAETMAARLHEIASTGLPYLVAEDENGIAGYAYAAPFRPRPAYRHTVEDSVYIRPGNEGQGIGFLLIDELIERTEAWGARQMIAVIGGSENAGSISLHTKCGFARTGIYTAAGWKFGRWLDVVLMQRALGSGATSPP